MQWHNVLYGVGCPICRFSKDLASELATRYPDRRLAIFSNPQGKPKASLVRYQVVPYPWELSDNFGWAPQSLLRSTIASALRAGRRPGDEQGRVYEVAVQTQRAFMEAFPLGKIRFSGKRAPGTTTPGPFFWIDTGARLMRLSMSCEHLRSDGILKICRREQIDRDLDRSYRAESDACGAIIDGYETVEPQGLKIRYRNRANLPRFDTLTRAREIHWGQTKFRKGEKLCAIIVAEMFPADDWVYNKRFDFLRDKSVNNGKSQLELDGYSPGQRLAFEYQGVQHFKALSPTAENKENLATIQQRDRFKVRRCRELGIDLVVVPHQELDPDAFTLAIRTILNELQITPKILDVRLDVIWTRWISACQNPMASFQKTVMTNLGEHVLVAPIASRIGKRSELQYQCHACGTLNTVLAKSLSVGEPRRYCPSCMGSNSGMKRRHQLLKKWQDVHLLPSAFIDNLRSNSKLGATQYRCAHDHLIHINDVAHAMRHIHDGVFECPECRGGELGVSRNQVAQQASYQQRFNDDLTSLGLKLLAYLPRKNGEIIANVRCASGQHTFEVTRFDVSGMLRNACLNDQSIATSACRSCCYPGVDVDAARLMRGTVFHRLKSLRGMYPNVRYLEHFDPAGRQAEHYSCGEHNPDGTPHPPILISGRNLLKAGDRYPSRHLCAACGLQVGQVGSRSKRLQDLVCLMIQMRAELQRYKPTAIVFHPPEVRHVSGPLNPLTQEVSTTKTKLSFWCGHPEHFPMIATKDYYFNRAASRGYGFCKQCVIDSKLTKAPMPAAPAGVVRALTPCTLRNPI